MEEVICAKTTIKNEPVSDKEEVMHIEHAPVLLEEVKQQNCVKEEPGTEVQVKIEPICTEELPTRETLEEQACLSTIVKSEIVGVKGEPESDGSDWEPSEDTAQHTLYAGHEVKQDLVIGMEALQPPDAVFATVPPYEVDVLYKQGAKRSAAKAADGDVQTLLRPRKSARRPAEEPVEPKIKRVFSLAHKNKAATQRTQYKFRNKLPSNLDPSDDRFVCDMCNKMFTNKTRLIRHIVYFHTKTNKYYCGICNKQYSSHTYAYTHLKLHASVKEYTCKICKKGFACASYLTRHERIHEGQKPYSCDVCKKQFRERSQLYIHAMIHEGEKAKRYSCSVCPMKFLQRYKLARHERVHTQDLPYACNICGKKFSQNFQLGVHVRIHTGEKPFSCEVCEKNFVSKTDLVRHERIHTGTKPYSCDVCGKQFSQKGHLNGHRIIHTGEKPYSCDQCLRTFSAKGTLNRHKKTHTRETSYSCEICDRQFKQHGRLKRHMESHNLESDEKL